MQVLELVEAGLAFEDVKGADGGKGCWRTWSVARMFRCAELGEPLVPPPDVRQKARFGVYGGKQQPKGMRKPHVQRVADALEVWALCHLLQFFRRRVEDDPPV